MNTPSINSKKWILRTTYYIHSRHTHRPIALLVLYIHTIVKELMKHGKCHCSKVLPSFITLQVHIGGNTIAFENSAINCC